MSIRKFSITETKTWEQLEDKQIFGGDVLDESYGHRMSAMYWQLGKGEHAEVPAPYDEVWIVTRGAVTIRSGEDRVTAHGGELLLVPEATPGVAEAEADTELFTVAHPPKWEIDPATWEAVRKGADTGARPYRLTIASVTHWQQLGQAGAQLGFAADEALVLAMRVGFGRFPRDATFTLPDGTGADQLVVPTTGVLVLRTDQAQLTVTAAEFVYLPAGRTGQFHVTDDDAEAVLVRAPAAP